MDLESCHSAFRQVEALLKKFPYRTFNEIDFGTFPIDSIRQTMEGSFFSAERQLRDLLENEVGNFFKRPDLKRHELLLLNNLLVVYTNFYEGTFHLLAVKKRDVMELIKSVRVLINLLSLVPSSSGSSPRASGKGEEKILDRLQLLVGMTYPDAEELIHDRYPSYTIRISSIGGVNQDLPPDLVPARINVDIDPASNRILSVLGFG
jgi:hypothetical protein